MSVPDFQTWFLPLLQEFQNQKLQHIRPLYETLATKLNLTPEEKAEKLPSGKELVYKNRIGWARTYLSKAGLITSPKRGHWQITQRGLEVLATQPEQLKVRDLKQFPEFVNFHSMKPTSPNPSTPATELEDNTTPEEALESAYKSIKQSTTSELLDLIKQGTPDFFEELVVKLLLAMGYGSAVEDAGRVLGKSGDGGIDGVIAEDPLGFDSIYIQAKRWENTVGRPMVQAFAGSLDGVRAKKGVMITTAKYSAEAKDYVSQIEKKIVLIDGQQLVDLMFQYNLGVTPIQSFEIKRIDQDFFEDL